jgi:DNA-binding MarR family transcriptional regulator
MDQTDLSAQAKEAASLLLTLTRELFAPDNDMVEELPLAQLRVCGILYGGPRSMSSLSRELGVSFSAMTQIADRLERARLVKRVAGEADRRVRCLQLTRRGQNIMRLREEARVRRVLALWEHLPAQAGREVLATLELMATACLASKTRTLSESLL